MTPRTYASGEVDRRGRISKCGDAMVRSLLFEAALSLLTRVKTWSALKSWGMRIAKRRGLRRAQVAVARRLAVVMHRTTAPSFAGAGRTRKRPPEPGRTTQSKEGLRFRSGGDCPAGTRVEATSLRPLWRPRADHAG